MQQPIKDSPLLLVLDESWEPFAGDTDQIIWAVRWPDGVVEIEAPQFGITADAEVVNDDFELAVDHALRRLMVRLTQYHQALRELPEDYLTEVERAQLNLFENLLFPWFARVVVGSPSGWDVPRDMLDQATSRPRHLV